MWASSQCVLWRRGVVALEAEGAGKSEGGGGGGGSQSGRLSPPSAGPRLQHAGLRKLFSWQPSCLPACTACLTFTELLPRKERGELLSQ